MSEDDDVTNFWAYCADVGVVSKRLTLRRPRSGNDGASNHGSAGAAVIAAQRPLVLVADEALSPGGLVVSVPYTSVLNAQTLRGGLLPRCTPPFVRAARFLTRRGRMDMLAASALWLTAFVACQRRQVRVAQQQASSDSSIGDSSDSDIGRTRCRRPLRLSSRLLSQQEHVMRVSPLLSPTLLPLAAVTTTRSSAHAATTTVTTAHTHTQTVQHQAMLLLHALLVFYAKHTRVPRVLLPTVAELQATHATVQQRALPLPLHCTPSAPAEVAELLAASPQLPLLASLVPVIDLLRPVQHVADGGDGSDDGDEDAKASAPLLRANCALYTCVEQSGAVVAGVTAVPPPRRRVLAEAAPQTARRVVVCTTTAVRAGEELCLALD